MIRGRESGSAQEHLGCRRRCVETECGETGSAGRPIEKSQLFGWMQPT